MAEKWPWLGSAWWLFGRDTESGRREHMLLKGKVVASTQFGSHL